MTASQPPQPPAGRPAAGAPAHRLRLRPARRPPGQPCSAPPPGFPRPPGHGPQPPPGSTSRPSGGCARSVSRAGAGFSMDLKKLRMADYVIGGRHRAVPDLRRAAPGSAWARSSASTSRAPTSAGSPSTGRSASRSSCSCSRRRGPSCRRSTPSGRLPAELRHGRAGRAGLLLTLFAWIHSLRFEFKIVPLLALLDAVAIARVRRPHAAARAAQRPGPPVRWPRPGSGPTGAGRSPASAQRPPPRRPAAGPQPPRAAAAATRRRPFHRPSPGVRRRRAPEPARGGHSARGPERPEPAPDSVSVIRRVAAFRAPPGACVEHPGGSLARVDTWFPCSPACPG